MRNFIWEIKEKVLGIWRKIISQKRLYFLLERTIPASKVHGFDRGRPIDRHFIETFLEKNSDNIRGRCLEIRDGKYTKKFGGKKILQGDVLDIDKNNKEANIYGDLCNLKEVKDETYDCIILTQVLQFIDNPEAALKECKRVLKIGGVLLVTVPSVSRIDKIAGENGDFWRWTKAGAKVLFEKIFQENFIEVESRGNSLTSTYSLLGFACKDLSKKKLNYDDPNFPCIITIKARK